jgi:hypothetical protein
MPATATKKKPLAKAAKRQAKTPVTIRKPLVKITAKGNVTQDLERIFSDGVLVDLQIGFWSAKRRNTADDLGIEQEDIPEFVIGLGTKRLVPKELSDSWQRLAARARYILRHHSFVFPIGNTSFAPTNSLPFIEEELNKLKEQFEKAGESLWKNYDKIRADMLEEFPQHRAALSRLYPPRELVRRAFYFTWDVFNVTLPKREQLAAFDRKKAADGEKALARYRVKLEERMQNFVVDVVSTMRAKVAAACLAITERVKGGDVVTNRSLNSLRGFIESYRELNFAGDQRIETMLTALEKEVLTNDADAFKDDAALQRTLIQTLDNVRKAAEAVTDISEITGGYQRRIRV